MLGLVSIWNSLEQRLLNRNSSKIRSICTFGTSNWRRTACSPSKSKVITQVLSVSWLAFLHRIIHRMIFTFSLSTDDLCSWIALDVALNVSGLVCLRESNLSWDILSCRARNMDHSCQSATCESLIELEEVTQLWEAVGIRCVEELLENLALFSSTSKLSVRVVDADAWRLLGRICSVTNLIVITLGREITVSWF